MPLIRADRVKESSTSTSTSAFLLNGADSTYRTFASVCAVGDTVYYAIAHRSANEWEVGLGTYSATNTLTRTTVHASSNANAAVAFSTGTKDVLLALTKAQLETYASLAGTETLTNKTISGANNTITNVSLATGATGTLPIANGGTGATTAQLAINALAGAVTSGSYLRGNGTNVVMAAIQAADVPTLNQNTTGTASNVTGTVAIANGGTGAVTAAAAYNALSPMTTLGDITYEASGGSAARLAGNTTATKQFLVQTGTGTVSAAPTWATIAAGDVPTLNQNTTGTASGSVSGTASYVPKFTGTNVVGNSQIIDNGTSVGIGTTSPSGRLHVRSSAASSWIVYLQNSAGTYAGGIYQSYTNNTGLYLADSAGADKVQLIAQSSISSFIATGANFGIGTTTPASGFHVANLISTFESASAASKVVIVKGAAAQSANLQEWQDNASTAVASIASNGSMTITNGTNIKLELARTSFQWSGIRFTDTAGSFDMNGGGDGLLLITPAASKKALQVRGSASQAANLQEWQNSAGTALATVNASGSLATSGLATSGSITLSSGLKTDYTKEYDFLRAAPTTVGDYVEICSYFSFSHSLEVTAVSQQGAGIGTTIKKYIINSVYGWWNFTLAPIAMERQGNYESTFDFELEIGPPDGNFNVPLRLRRTAGTSARNVLITVKNISVYGHDLTPLSGTGTSAISVTNVNGAYINPYNYALPVPGTSGSGRDIGFYAGSAIGTGAGGNILLQAGAFATSGSNGKVIVRGLASNTANLQEWQNNAGTVLSAVNSAGSFTNTGGQSQSEEFGNGAVVSGSYATAIGYGTSAAQLSTAVGWNCTANGVAATSIGDASSSSGDYSVAIGRQASATVGAIAIGLNATATSNGISIGRSSSSAGIMLGYQYAGAGIGYTTLSASADGRSATGAIEVIAGDGVNYNTNYSRQHSILGTWATATYASRLGRVQLRVNDFTTDREAIRYESDGANALTSIGGAAVIASTTLAVQPAVSGNKGVVVKGASGQSANLQEWQNSAGTALAYVNSAGAGKLTTSLSIENASISGKNATLTVSPVASGSTTDLTVGGDLYRIYLQAADNVMFSTSLGTDTGVYPRFNGSGLRLASGALTFRTGQTWQGSDDVGITWGASGTMRVSNASTGGGSFAFTSNSPAAFTADQNDLALNGSAFQRLSGTAARNITGIAPPSGSHVDGRMIRLYNVGSFNLTLKHNSTSSTAANRFWNVQAIDIIVGANDYAELIYDGTNNGSGAAGWRVA